MNQYTINNFPLHSGPPPHVGWWNALALIPGKSKPTYLFLVDADVWRWWDGKNWSWAAFSSEKAEFAAHCAGTVEIERDIYWTHYYPENARVPRINPNENNN